MSWDFQNSGICPMSLWVSLPSEFSRSLSGSVSSTLHSAGLWETGCHIHLPPQHMSRIRRACFWLQASFAGFSLWIFKQVKQAIESKLTRSTLLRLLLQFLPRVPALASGPCFTTAAETHQSVWYPHLQCASSSSEPSQAGQQLVPGC